MSFAKAFVSGTVVKAPEKRFTQNDMAIAGFSLNIDPQNETILRVVAFGNLAENVSATVTQGDEVLVEGRLQINTYKLPNGKDKKVFEINANAVEKMGAGSSKATAAVQNSENIVSFNQDEIAQDLIDEDEIPF